MDCRPGRMVYWLYGWGCRSKYNVSKTRLYIDCPNCHTQYILKDFKLTFSNGGYIENVRDSTEWQLLFCPCRPKEPYKFKVGERARIHVFAENDVEQTHFSLTARDRTNVHSMKVS